MGRHQHVRQAQHDHMHHSDHGNHELFDAVAEAVAGAPAILLVGHGTGKANEMLRLTQYWERKHPEVARKVVGAIDSNLEALSSNQILELVRAWFDEYHDFL